MNKVLSDSDKTLYCILACLRLLINFIPQTGYIHPDEFFQLIEVAAGDSFDIDVYKPREFNVTFPMKSSLFPQVCVGIPYFILKNVNPHCEYFFGFSLNTPYFLLLFPRLIMTILSFISDYCLYKICLILHEPYIGRLTIFASSYVILIFSTRTFSNSIEIVLTSTLLYYASRCIEFSNKVVIQSDYLNSKYYKAKSGVERTKFYKLLMSLPSHSLNDCLTLATITVLGIFNRPTFIAFAIAPIFFWLQRGLGSKSVGFLDFHLRMFIFVLFTIPAIVSLIVYDSFYYGYLTMEEIGKVEISMDNFVVTPLNFLRYNLLTDNLKNNVHYLHLSHLLVNVPLLFNILGIVAIITFTRMVNSVLKGKWLELPRIQSTESLMVSSFVVPIALLSIFSHQEPRYIIPVILPLVFLFTHWIKDSSRTSAVNVSNIKVIPSMVTRKSNNLITIWYFCNICLALFYGFLHQGGIISVTNYLYNELKAKPQLTHLHYVSSFTYPLPTSLLQLKNTKKLYISNSGHKFKLTKDFFSHELGSKSIDYVYNQIALKVKNCEKDLKKENIPYRFYYALPQSFYNEFKEYYLRNETKEFKFNLIKSFNFHVTMEKFPILITSECLNLSIAQSFLFTFLKNFPSNIFVCSKQFSLILLQIEYMSS